MAVDWTCLSMYRSVVGAEESLNGDYGSSDAL